MSKIFSFNSKRNGSYIDGVSGAVGVNTAGVWARTEKGLTWRDVPDSKIDFITTIGVGALSVEVWFKADKLFGGTDTYRGTLIGSTTNLRLHTRDDNKLKFTRAGVGFALSIANSLNINNWNHILITSEADGTSAFYVNGVDVTDTSDASTPVADDVVQIGNDGVGLGPGGDIGRIQIYDHILTPAERATFYKEFLDAAPIQRAVEDNFDYPALKPHDLSHLVDSVVTDLGKGLDFIDDSWEVTGNVSIVDNNTFLSTDGTGVCFKTIFWTAEDVGKTIKLLLEFFNSDGDNLQIRTSGSNATFDGSISKEYAPGSHEIDVVVSGADNFVLDATGTGSTYDFSLKVLQQRQGLVAAYNMIPSPEGKLVDISGEGNEGAINGAVSSKDGMVFDNIDDYVQLASDIVLAVSGWTLAVRLSGQGASGSTRAILGQDVTNSSRRIVFTGADELYIETDTNDDDSVSSDNSYNENTPVDYIITVSAGIVRAWQDGVELTMSGNLVDDLTINRIGRTASASSPGFGFIDMQIFNYAVDGNFAKNYHNQFAKEIKHKDRLALDFGVGDTI
jgi:hypothetical protein